MGACCGARRRRPNTQINPVKHLGLGWTGGTLFCRLVMYITLGVYHCTLLLYIIARRSSQIRWGRM